MSKICRHPRGALLPPSANRAAPPSPAPCRRDVRLHGFWLNFWLESLGERREAVLSEVMGLIEEGVLAPDSGRRFPLAEVRAAVEESQRSGHGGKVLLEG